MGIVDTLVQHGDQSAHFIVNTAVDYVDIIPPVGDGVLSIGGVFNAFVWKDQINLLSFCALLPLSFEFYQNQRMFGPNPPWPDSVKFRYQRVSDGVFFDWIPNTYNLISGNYELNIGAYLEPDPLIENDYHITARLPDDGFFVTRISMIGVPAALNGKDFACPIFVKLEHTEKMI